MGAAVVRALFEAAAQQDFERTIAFYDPGVEWDVSRLGLADFGDGIYRGHEGLRRWFGQWSEAWEIYRNDLEELLEGTDGRIASVTTQRGRGSASGAEVEIRQYAVWTIRGGKIVRVVWFLTRAEALEAAGLSE